MSMLWPNTAKTLRRRLIVSTLFGVLLLFLPSQILLLYYSACDIDIASQHLIWWAVHPAVIPVVITLSGLSSVYSIALCMDLRDADRNSIRSPLNWVLFVVSLMLFALALFYVFIRIAVGISRFFSRP